MIELNRIYNEDCLETMQKYEIITDQEDANYGHIRALIDFGNVKKGDLGGKIDNYNNLSQEDNCWVGYYARVYGNAEVCGNAEVFGEVEVRGEWVEHEYEMECPQCGCFWNYCDNDTERFNYCPNCGAKMEED